MQSVAGQVARYQSYEEELGAMSCATQALVTLGRIYQELGHSEEAIARNKEAWELWESTPASAPGSFRQMILEGRKAGMTAPVPQGACGGKTEFGDPSLWSVDKKAAEGHLGEALKDLLEKAAVSTAVRPSVWERIAGLEATMGSRDQALVHYRRAIDAAEAVQGRLSRAEMMASWASHQEPLYAQAVRLLFDLQQPEEAFSLGERARARAFLEQIGNRRLPALGVPENLEKEVREVRQRLIEIEARARANVDQREKAGDADHEEEETIRAHYRDLLTAVSRSNPEYASLLKVDTVGLRQLQNGVLDERTSLVEYFILQDKLLAWVIDRDSVHWLALPISATELRGRVSYLRDLIAARRFSKTAAGSLYDIIFAPLETYIVHRNVVIVPQGPLHFLPFGSLWSTARGRFLAEDYSLTLTPSASVLRFLRRNPRPARTKLLALGDPDGSLPHADQEVREIGRLFGAVPRVGAEARKSRLFAEGRDAGIVHIAAHATYDPLRPMLSHLNLAPGGGQSDGKLHVFEVYGLDLQSARLVVLSGCNTALGPQDEGDDLVGLPRAFLYAGAPTVLSTLWPVDDDATAEFMRQFYQRLRDGRPAAEALSGAQRQLLEHAELREPYFWAGFTLTGAWTGFPSGTGIP